MIFSQPACPLCQGNAEGALMSVWAPESMNRYSAPDAAIT